MENQQPPQENPQPPAEQTNQQETPPAPQPPPIIVTNPDGTPPTVSKEDLELVLQTYPGIVAIFEISGDEATAAVNSLDELKERSAKLKEEEQELLYKARCVRRKHELMDTVTNSTALSIRSIVFEKEPKAEKIVDQINPRVAIERRLFKNIKKDFLVMFVPPALGQQAAAMIKNISGNQ